MPTTVRRNDTTAQVRVDVELVTPHKASDWLEKNRRNRPKREGQIDRYIDQMKEGNWMVSPDAIAFDENGRLINGQHRLTAIVRAGQAQRQLVARGLDPDARLISDVGAKRTASDMLHIEGYRHPQELGAALKLVALWLDGRLEECGQYENVEKRRIVELAERCTPRIYDSIGLVHKHKQFMADAIPRTLVTFAHFIYEPTYGEKVGRYIEEAFDEKAARPDWVKTEEGFQRSTEVGDLSDYDEEDFIPSPALFIFKWCQENRDVPRKKWLAYLLKSMNWFMTDDPHKALRWTSKQSFPKPKVDMLPELQGELEL